MIKWCLYEDNDYLDHLPWANKENFDSVCHLCCFLLLQKMGAGGSIANLLPDTVVPCLNHGSEGFIRKKF